MKKLIIGIAMAVAGVQLNANADYLGDILYWQIPTEGAAARAGYSYANLLATVDGQGNVSLESGGWSFVNEGMSGLVAEADLSGISGTISSFFVEYFNGSNEQIGSSEVVSFANLVNNGFIGNLQKQPIVPNTGVWAPTFAAIPEPTSGLLVLLGVAGLALRRKRA